MLSLPRENVKYWLILDPCSVGVNSHVSSSSGTHVFRHSDHVIHQNVSVIFWMSPESKSYICVAEGYNSDERPKGRYGYTKDVS